jgi:glycosyltransferase involved in cell wall biosynthesis
MHKLSVVIITYNEEENILRCVNSVNGLADEIVIVDSLSTDRTAEICRSAGCKVIPHAFEGYGQQKQFAVDHAANDWILSLDADEVVTPELKAEIKALMEQDSIPCDGYRICFSLFYMGRELRRFGSHSLRLFDRRKSRFRVVMVHESVEADGTIGNLKGRIIHYSYRDLSHHFQKINSYTSRAAEENAKDGKHYRKAWVAFKFPVSFFIYYFIRLGILDGYPGFLWSFFAALYGSLKVAKTIELQKKK